MGPGEVPLCPPPSEGLYIRAVPVYADASDLRTPVKRCPNHSRAEDPTNTEFSFPLHLIRFDTEAALYCEDLTSGRLSVLVPIGQPQEGDTAIHQLVKFMCLGSDVGGINRRPLRVIFTLEDEQTNIFGRHVVEVRICCCPRRDKAIEVEKVERYKDTARNVAKR